MYYLDKFIGESEQNPPIGFDWYGKSLAGRQWVTYKTLEDVKQAEAGYVVLEGDLGGQIYVVCPASRVQCSEADLITLLFDLDYIEWGFGTPPKRPMGQEGFKSPENAADILYDAYQLGDIVPGGMGGGLALKDIWIHNNLIQKNLHSAITDVITGREKRLQWEGKN